MLLTRINAPLTKQGTRRKARRVFLSKKHHDKKKRQRGVKSRAMTKARRNGELTATHKNWKREFYNDHYV